MSTVAASRFDEHGLRWFYGVAARSELRDLGISSDDIAAQVAAKRWQAWGRAVLLHNGEPTTEQARRIAIIRCGPGSVLTSFSSLEERGLRGWEREDIHVLVGRGARSTPPPGVVLHRSRRVTADDVASAARLHRTEPATVIACASFARPRPACGLLVATVQQRLTDVNRLREAFQRATRTRHRAMLLLALDDIEQGARALSEIDLGVLCRRAGLPAPIRQGVRIEPSGRRRYLDAEWPHRSGGRRAVEVDGALHLKVGSWWDDQLRQNEVVIGGTPVLRFPSVVVRTEPDLVTDQLRRFLR